MKPSLCLILVNLIAFPSSVFAFHESGDFEHHTLEIQHARMKLERELKKYEQEIQQSISKFEEKTAKVWGDETVVPDASQDVAYRNNQSERSIINYEDGKVVVEIAVNIDKSMNKRRIAEQLSNAVSSAILNGPDIRSYQEMAENPDAPDSANPANSLVSMVADKQEQQGENYVQEFSKNQIKRTSQRELTGKDGNVRIVFTTQFNLVPDHIRIRAQKYKDMVDLHARKFHIPTPLIYAIMETESFFNPFAKSPVPAFGLMQLVPTTGARDAYKFLYNKDIVVKEKYLYKPNKNIELGVAYMHVIYYKYLHKIKNPTSRLWVMIAAYNTGVINVMRSFQGEYVRAKYGSMYAWKNLALDKVNKMKPDQVFDRLIESLPAEETRNYLLKVRERMSKYSI